MRLWSGGWSFSSMRGGRRGRLRVRGWETLVVGFEVWWNGEVEGFVGGFWVWRVVRGAVVVGLCLNGDNTGFGHLISSHLIDAGLSW